MIRVLRHQLAAGAASLAVVAAVVCTLVAVLVAWPRALDGLVRQDLVDEVTELGWLRDLRPPADWRVERPTVPDPTAAGALLAEIADTVAAPVTDAGPAVRAVLTEPDLEVVRPPFAIDLGDGAPGISHETLAISVGDRRDDLELVAGAWPTAPTGPAGPAGPATAAITGQPVADVRVEAEIGVVMSVSTADWLAWEVGEVRRSRDVAFPVTVRLTGLVVAAEPDAELWAHLPGAIEPVVDRNDAAGWTAHAIAWADPAALPALLVPNGVVVSSWHPVDVAAVGRSDRSALAAQLDGLHAATGLRSELPGALATSAGREAALTTLLTALVAGLVSVGVGVLWLTCVLAVERQRPALVLMRARGGATARLSLLVGVQAALAAGTGAAVGLVLAVQVPGTTAPADLLPPAAVTAGAVLLMVVAAARVQPRRTARRARWRWAAEVAVLAATAAAVSSGTGGQTLVALVPVLVGLSAALVALRVEPWPARAALRAVQRRAELGTFLGAAHAARRPAAGLVPVVALTLGVATAILAVTAVTTTSRATERSADVAVGGDLRLDVAWRSQGGGLTEDELDEAGAVAGVAAIAAVADGGSTTLRHGRERTTVRVLVVDGPGLADVQADLLATPVTAQVAAVAPGVPTGDVTLDTRDGALPLEARAVTQVAGVTSGTGWVVVDRTTWAQWAGRPPVDRLLVRVEAGADADAVAAATGERLGRPMTATTRADATARFSDGVLVSAGRSAMIALAAAALVLVLVLLVLVLVAGAPERGRTAALLGTLGAPPGAHRRLVVAEVIGPLLVAGSAGAAAGALLPGVVLREADLRPFTGSAAPPPVVVDLGVLLALGGVLAAVVVIGALVAAAAARRVPAVRVLREGAGG